jgi:hypothetical protein
MPRCLGASTASGSRRCPAAAAAVAGRYRRHRDACGLRSGTSCGTSLRLALAPSAAVNVCRGESIGAPLSSGAGSNLNVQICSD